MWRVTGIWPQGVEYLKSLAFDCVYFVVISYFFSFWQCMLPLICYLVLYWLLKRNLPTHTHTRLIKYMCIYSI